MPSQLVGVVHRSGPTISVPTFVRPLCNAVTSRSPIRWMYSLRGRISAGRSTLAAASSDFIESIRSIRFSMVRIASKYSSNFRWSDVLSRCCN